MVGDPDQLHCSEGFELGIHLIFALQPLLHQQTNTDLLDAIEQGEHSLPQALFLLLEHPVCRLVMLGCSAQIAHARRG